MPRLDPIWQENLYPPDQSILNLGCGLRPMVGAVNHDRVPHSPWVDVYCDLESMPWVFKVIDSPDTAERMKHSGGLFNTVIALDVIEHITDVLGFVNECKGLLKPGGMLILRGAASDNPVAFTDPTHKHFFTRESFDYFDPSTNLGGHYGQFYTDSLLRPLSKWRLLSSRRTNADPRFPANGDWEYVLESL